MNHFPWFESFIVFSIAQRCFLYFLDARQYRHLQKRELHPTLKGVVEREDFDKSIHYSLDKLRFSMIRSSILFIIQLLTFITYLYPALWNISKQLSEQYIGYSTEYTQALIFSGIQMIVDRILSIPFELYADFVIEAKHGFNKKTLRLFIVDEIKTLLITTILGAPILCLIIWIVLWGGQTFYFWLWTASMILTIVMMTIYPNFIAPLFNKFEELKDQDLKVKIEGLAQQIHYPLKRIYQMDESTRSRHSNAYLYGFGNNKRIVLFDTLLESCHEKILAVVGHELGHWKLSHTLKNMVVSFVHLFFMFYLFGLIFYNQFVYKSFGFSPVERPVLIGFFLFMNVYEPIGLIASIFTTCMSRTHEFQADEFSAVTLGMNEDLQTALLELQKKNLGAYSVDSMYEWFHYSHPHLIKRLDALQQLAKAN